MSFDRAQFLETVREKAEQRTAMHMPMIRAAAAVAPIMERLMTTPDWDRYLQYLQARINQAKVSRETSLAKLASPGVFDLAEMTQLKTAINSADSMIQAWEFAMQLPRALTEGANAALELIAKFEEKNGHPAEQSQS